MTEKKTRSDPHKDAYALLPLPPSFLLKHIENTLPLCDFQMPGFCLSLNGLSLLVIFFLGLALSQGQRKGVIIYTANGNLPPKNIS